ncbi:hypothetical protein OPT61_g9179 [Boeremia exigua]|uniref:Uncharacterized protein n=1 Tax=Boeremia exigua TaxID=749465 RepID=A0ACC2HW25_9PLEO|nr:hypothetical protein OPT61_g9179 [Boeremia exigua]
MLAHSLSGRPATALSILNWLELQFFCASAATVFKLKHCHQQHATYTALLPCPAAPYVPAPITFQVAPARCLDGRHLLGLSQPQDKLRDEFASCYEVLYGPWRPRFRRAKPATKPSTVEAHDSSILPDKVVDIPPDNVMDRGSCGSMVSDTARHTATTEKYQRTAIQRERRRLSPTAKLDSTRIRAFRPGDLQLTLPGPPAARRRDLVCAALATLPSSRGSLCCIVSTRIHTTAQQCTANLVLLAASSKCGQSRQKQFVVSGAAQQNTAEKHHAPRPSVERGLPEYHRRIPTVARLGAGFVGPCAARLVTQFRFTTALGLRHQHTSVRAVVAATSSAHHQVLNSRPNTTTVAAREARRRARETQCDA